MVGRRHISKTTDLVRYRYRYCTVRRSRLACVHRTLGLRYACAWLVVKARGFTANEIERVHVAKTRGLPEHRQVEG